MIAVVLGLLLVACGAVSAQPALSPSIEADADYLLTTGDFMQAQFGMAVEAVAAEADHTVIRTTGAEFIFEPAKGLLHLKQRLGKPREAAVVSFPAGTLSGLRVTRQGTGAVLMTANGGRLRLRVNGDSLLMLKTATALTVSYRLGFSPGTLRQIAGNHLYLDEYGGVGSYVAAGPPRGSDAREGLNVTHSLKAGQFLWMSVGPPRPFDWQASLHDRVIWHWSNQTGYPTDAEIARWSKYGNMLLQQSEVMLWKDWSLRFIPRNGIEEFQRVNDTCRKFGMRNYVYTSPFYFLSGTGQEDKAMNSFEHFDQTGFSPGDDRGLNWPIFLSEITKVMREYKPQGLYFDGIYGNIVRTYLISRKAREVVGDKGILEYHATGSPPGGGVYLPQIDTYYTFMLRGEGCQDQYRNDDYLRYFVSTYNISNSIGVLCDNNDYKLDKPFIDTLLDRNIRLHLIPGWLDDYRGQVMAQDYWPALNAGLQARVDAACVRRNADAQRRWQRLDEISTRKVEGLKLLYEADFADAGLKAAAASPPPNQAVQVSPPGNITYVPLTDGWRGYLSPNSEGNIAAAGGVLSISARSNTCAYIERPLPDNAAAVQCKIRCMADGGMSWGPGLMLRGDSGGYRLNVRADDRVAIDRGTDQTLFDGYPAGQWYWLRMAMVEDFILSEVSRDGTTWQRLRVESAALGGHLRLLLGKIANSGTETEYAPVGGPGTSEIADVKVYGR